MTVESLLEEVKKYKTRYICITGGEPLIHKDIHILMNALVDSGYRVSLETSGNINCEDVNPRVKKIIDIKTPDSGAPNSFLLENLKFSDVNTEFKFVINSPEDFDWAEDFSQKNRLAETATVLYSPAFGKIDEKWLAKKMLSSHSYARLQLQLHKYIWPSQNRGV